MNKIRVLTLKFGFDGKSEEIFEISYQTRNFSTSFNFSGIVQLCTSLRVEFEFLGLDRSLDEKSDTFLKSSTPKNPVSIISSNFPCKFFQLPE